MSHTRTLRTGTHERGGDPYCSWTGGENHGWRRNQGKGEDTAVPLNPRDTELLWKLSREQPVLRAAMRESQDLLFGTPFQVAFGFKDDKGSGSGGSSSKRGDPQERLNRLAGRLLPLKDDVREHVIEKYWMAFLRDVDTWLRLFGLAPWFFRKLEGARADGSVKGRGAGGAGQSGEKAKYLHAADWGHSSREGAHGTLFETYVPVVPAFGTGQVETYVKSGQQHFQWRWLDTANLGKNRASMVDRKVHFILETGSEPDIRGEYRSDFISLAQDYAMVTIMRLNLLQAQRAALFPLHTIEWAPDIAKATGAGAQYAEGNSLEGGGGAFMSERHHQPPAASPLNRVQAERHASRSGNGYALTAEADYLPPDVLGEVTTWRAGTYAVNEKSNAADLRAQLEDRRQLLQERPELRAHLASPSSYLRGAPPGRPSLPPNTHLLEPYERMVTHAPVQPDMGHLMAVQNRFDQMLAMLADYPLEIVMGMGGKGGGGGAGPGGASSNNRPQSGGTGGSSNNPQQMPQKSGMYQYVIARQRARSNFFTKQVRRIFMLAYGATLQHARSESNSLFASIHGRLPNEREQLELNQRLDIHVFFPRTPLLSFDEMVVYYQHGLFSEEDFRKFALDVIGMEDRAPTQDYKKALRLLYKDPLELEVKKMRAEATVAAMTPQQGGSSDNDSGSRSGGSSNASKANGSKARGATTNDTKKRARESNGGANRASKKAKTSNGRKK